MNNNRPPESEHIEWTSIHRVENPELKSAELLEVMRKRRTVRHFSGRKVDSEVLKNLVRIAASAPSGANCQPWHFTIVTSPEKKKIIREEAEKVEKEFYSEKAPQRWLDDLKRFKTNWEKPHLEEAAALILVSSKPKAEDDEVKSYYATESVGIATGFLIAAAHQVGLGVLTHTPQPMKFLSQFTGLSSNYRPFMLLAVGYPQEPLMVPELNKKSEAEIMSEL